jgi:soluble lytic murein transglycosylase-like protein
MQPSHPHNILPYSRDYMKDPTLGIKYGFKHSSHEDKTIERTITT